MADNVTRRSGLAQVKRERLTFDDKQEWLAARTQDITSTEISALFGVCPYMTEFELWHRKKSGTIEELEPNERMKWGSRFEDAIARGVAEDRGWDVVAFNQYVRIPELRLGSTYDYRIQGQDKALLEIKNVDWLIARDHWILEKDRVEAPPHIEFQLQHQMLVADYDHGHIAAMVGGNDVRHIEREADDKVRAAILSKSAAFWNSIDEDRPPTPDFDRDADYITAMAVYAEPGSYYDATDNPGVTALCERYQQVAGTIRDLEKDKKAFKAQLLLQIGDAEKVTADGFTISAGIVGEKLVPEHLLKAYRNFRVYTKKKKES